MNVRDWCIFAFSILVLVCAAAQGVVAAEAGETLIFVVRARSSPPYDAVFSGFKVLIEESGFHARYEIHDAENGNDDLDGFLENAKTEAADLVFTIGTSVTRRVIDKDVGIPLVYSMVIDTVGLGEANDVTGVTLEFAAPFHFKWMKRFLPDARRIGVIYNPEKNGQRVDRARREAQEEGLTLKTQGVDRPQDIPAALDRISRDIDVLWGIPDDVVLNPKTAKQILLFCYRQCIPFVGPSEAWVKAGALYALDRDYGDIGAQCGEMAVALLNGNGPAEINPETPHKITYFVNLKTARHMKLDIDEELLARANGVY
jgi:putative ABC transport system substrate-binding protein